MDQLVLGTVSTQDGPISGRCDCIIGERVTLLKSLINYFRKISVVKATQPKFDAVHSN